MYYPNAKEEIKMKVTYAAFFSENKNEVGEITGYAVRVPDVHECMGGGKDFIRGCFKDKRTCHTDDRG